MCCVILFSAFLVVFFFFNDTATTEIYTLSLHDALPICLRQASAPCRCIGSGCRRAHESDRKSTRLNSSHVSISYAVFCLKKKNKMQIEFYLNKKRKIKNKNIMIQK